LTQLGLEHRGYDEHRRAGAFHRADARKRIKDAHHRVDMAARAGPERHAGNYAQCGIEHEGRSAELRIGARQPVCLADLGLEIPEIPEAGKVVRHAALALIARVLGHAEERSIHVVEARLRGERLEHRRARCVARRTEKTEQQVAPGDRIEAVPRIDGSTRDEPRRVITRDEPPPIAHGERL
jgi:hypothetical protein